MQLQVPYADWFGLYAGRRECNGIEMEFPVTVHELRQFVALKCRTEADIDVAEQMNGGMNE